MNEVLIEFIRGDTFAFLFEIEGLEDTLDSCYFSCKENVNDTEYCFQKSLGDGIQQISAEQYRVKIERADTIDLKVGQYYYCDLKIERGGIFLTPITGKIKLKQDITR